MEILQCKNGSIELQCAMAFLYQFIISTHDKISGKSKDKLRIMINFAVDDIYKWYNKLLSLNIKIIQPPYSEEWGGYICTFEDIDENIIQFIQIN